MARRKRGSSSEQPIGVGLTAKQMKRKKPLNNGYLIDIEPLSDNQKKLFDYLLYISDISQILQLFIGFK